MFPLAVPLIAAGASLLGNVLGRDANTEANYEDRVQADKTNQQQMDFQRDMSNTAHQREVTDLKAAGLNPILSANAGASSPSGGSAMPGPARPASIQMPDLMSMFAFSQNEKKIDQDQQRIGIEKQNSAASIAKNLSDKDLNRMKEVMLKKGMPSTEYEANKDKTKGDILDFLKNQFHKNTPPRATNQSWQSSMDDAMAKPFTKSGN